MVYLKIRILFFTPRPEVIHLILTNRRSRRSRRRREKEDEEEKEKLMHRTHTGHTDRRLVLYRLPSDSVAPDGRASRSRSPCWFRVRDSVLLHPASCAASAAAPHRGSAPPGNTPNLQVTHPPPSGVCVSSSVAIRPLRLDVNTTLGPG